MARFYLVFIVLVSLLVGLVSSKSLQSPQSGNQNQNQNQNQGGQQGGSQNQGGTSSSSQGETKTFTTPEKTTITTTEKTTTTEATTTITTTTTTTTTPAPPQPDKGLEWPTDKACKSKDDSYKLENLKSEQFNNYISMYHYEESGYSTSASKFKLYKIDNTSTTELFGDAEPSTGGLPMKFFQATVKGKNYLVQFDMDVGDRTKGTSQLTVYNVDGPNFGKKSAQITIPNPPKAFVLGEYAIVGRNMAYDLKKILNPASTVVNSLTLNDVEVDGKELPDDVKNRIGTECFENKNFCAQYLPGTKNYDAKEFVGVSQKEVVLFLDKDGLNGDSFIYVRHGEDDIGLKENKRYYYFPQITNQPKTITVYYIEQNLQINQVPQKPNGINVMMFPFVGIDDKFVKPFVAPPTTKTPSSTTISSIGTTFSSSTTSIGPDTHPPPKPQPKATTEDDCGPCPDEYYGYDDFGTGTFGGHFFLFKTISLSFVLLFLTR